MRRARMPLAATVAAAVVAVVASSALAIPGALNGVFDHRGMVAEPYGKLSFNNAAAVQPDGRIVTVGEAEMPGNRDALISTRLLPNGRLDPTYGNNGWVVLNPSGSSAGGSAVTILSNGDILIGGGAHGASNQPLSFAAVKLLPNGQLDKAFGNGGVATVPIGIAAIANAIAVQPDGKIVLGGTTQNGGDRFAVARLSAGGALDRSFGSNGVTMLGSNAAAWGLGIRPDGSIVLAGVVAPNLSGSLVGLLSLVSLGGVSTRLSNGQQYMAAAVTSSGQPDTSFGNKGIMRLGIGEKAFCTAVAVESDGKVLLAGNAFTNTGIAATVQLMPNGSIDKSFAANGYSEQPVWDGVNAVAMQPDGKILLATTGPTVIRLDQSGVPDAGFGTNGITRIGNGKGNAANGITYDQLNGDIVLSGVMTLSKRTDASVVSVRGS